MFRKAWFCYAVALLATVAACVLWLVVFSELRDSPSRSRDAVAPVITSPGVLPVPLRIRPAAPARAVLFDRLQRGQVVCFGGFYAARAADGLRLLYLNGERVPCP